MYKFTNVQSDIANVPINMRHEASMLTNEFGINLLYIRNCKFVRCKCFNDLNKTGNPDCPLCFGSGHFASVQKIQAIESSNSPYSSTNALHKLPVGVTDQKNEVYYIKHGYNPKERDYLLKVTWDKKGNPVDIAKVLEIINVYEMRGDNGRVELNGCIVDNRTDMVRTFAKMLHNLPQKSIHELTKGGKGIWPMIL